MKLTLKRRMFFLSCISFPKISSPGYQLLHLHQLKDRNDCLTPFLTFDSSVYVFIMCNLGKSLSFQEWWIIMIQNNLREGKGVSMHFKSTYSFYLCSWHLPIIIQLCCALLCTDRKQIRKRNCNLWPVTSVFLVVLLVWIGLVLSEGAEEQTISLQKENKSQIETLQKKTGKQ